MTHSTTTRRKPVNPPWWTGRPVFLIGGGPSLRGRDLTRLKERGWVVGLNDAAFLVPCDCAFSIDRTWLHRRANRLLEYPGEVYVALGEGDTESFPFPEKIHYLDRIRNAGMCKDSSQIANGLNTGYSAINLALHKRATHVVLLGYDLIPTGSDPTHWHGGYQWNSGTSLKYYDRWAKRFDEIPPTLPPEMKVVNANPKSAVTAFPFTSYEEYGL